MKNLIILTLLLVFVTLTAQDIERDFNKFSIEVATGFQAPLSPNDGGPFFFGCHKNGFPCFNGFSCGRG